MRLVHIIIADAVLRALEACFLHAYPDPASPLGQALGQRGINDCGRTGLLPHALAHLDGSPWTIGHGETRGIRRGMVWTQAQADQALQRRLMEFDRRVCKVWRGADQLQAMARAALLVLAYNRGTAQRRSSSDKLDRRREMRDLGPAIEAADYRQMADLIRSMKRLWEGRNLGGLIKRRELEAVLCELAHALADDDNVAAYDLLSGDVWPTAAVRSLVEREAAGFLLNRTTATAASVGQQVRETIAKS